MTENNEFKRITSSKEYQRLKDFYQHGTCSVYDHSISVCSTCFKIAKKIHLKVNEDSLVKGSLLHDYFLYDWHQKGAPIRHLVGHPANAAKNAKADFGLTKKEERMIRAHMFPAGLKIPTSREGILLCIADKYCATREFIRSRRQRRKKI